MPWNETSVDELRRDFVVMAQQEGCHVRHLCQCFGISAKTGYKWLERYAHGGVAALTNHSCRPLSSPQRTAPDIERLVLKLRHEHPAWGGRKLARRLNDLGLSSIPVASTVTEILRRHGQLGLPEGEGRQTRYHRFEHDAPNQLWQIDFKSPVHTARGVCHPLTVLDDHSRYNLVLHACSRQRTQDIQPIFTDTFRRYGLPIRINADNGPPWGSSREPSHGLSTFSVWLVRLGIRISHSRPYHPQTNGKDERFHRSLGREVLNAVGFADKEQLQRALSRWRLCYNHERPHEALQLSVPAARYRPSARAYPEHLPAIEYGPDDDVVRVSWNGEMRAFGQKWKVPKALNGLNIAIRPAHGQEDGLYHLYFCHHCFGQLDLRIARQ